MKWSYRITEIRGIAVYVHATFLALLAVVVVSQWAASRDVGKALEGLAFMLALFGCVVLHELGHALTALRFGVRTRDITLYPIGGVARLEQMPKEPIQELLVALAGPAVNVGIALILFAIWLAIGGLGGAPGALAASSLTEGSLLGRLLVINVALAAFNLLPAFPMDGGRVLRAGLATRMDYNRATQIAASAGQAMALLFGLVGFFANPFLIFIALFVWVGAAQEAGQVQLRTALQGLPVVRAMETVFRVLAPGDPLTRAVDETLASPQQDFPVLDGGLLVGLLTRRDLLAGLTQRGPGSSVAESMQRSFATIEAGELLEEALQRLELGENRTIPVTRGGTLVGLVTIENVGELVAFRASIEQATAAIARR